MALGLLTAEGGSFDRDVDLIRLSTGRPCERVRSREIVSMESV
jgi:hypothetical protein